MTQRERYEKIFEWFEREVPVAESELNYSNPYELLVAVILSAQCTDKRVNIVTPSLFKQFLHHGIWRRVILKRYTPIFAVFHTPIIRQPISIKCHKC